MILSLLLMLTLASTSVSHEVSDFQDSQASMSELAAYHTSPCTYKALKQYLDQCTETSFDLVDSQLRLELAVKLSICEFEEARVRFPEKCASLNSHQDFLDCVHEFRASSQLWTSYSGNYRKLRTMCYEELYPHAKNHIIELFLNITLVYSGFYESLLHSFDSVSGRQSELSEQLEILLKVVNEAISQKLKEMEYLERENLEYVLRTQKLYSDFEMEISKGLGGILSGTSDMKDVLDTVKEDTSNMGEEFRKFAREVSVTGTELAVSQNIERNAIMEQYHDLWVSLSQSQNMALQLEMFIHNIAQDAHLQLKLVLANLESMSHLNQEISNFLVSFADFYLGLSHNTTLLAANIGAISDTAEIAREKIDSELLRVLSVVSNVTDSVSDLSLKFSQFLSSKLTAMFLTLISYFIQVLATTGIFIVGGILIFYAAKSKLLRFLIGLVPGLFIGLVLRLAIQNISLVHISVLDILHLGFAWVQDLVR